MIVVLDGPAGSGKSSTARRVAAALGFVHLDTGASYRAVTLAALRADIDLDDEEALTQLCTGLTIALEGGRVSLDGQDVSAEIRSPEVSRTVSLVARHPQVRAQMVELQRQVARGRDVVGEGRDLASVVFPDADLKIYLNASPLERARRRAGERGLHSQADIEALTREIAERDRIDSTRAASPLMQTEDAELLDTTSLTLEQVVAQVVARVRSLRA